MTNPIAIQVNKSRQRKKTLQAKFDDKSHTLIVSVPENINQNELEAFINRCITKVEAKQKIVRNQERLEERAKALAKTYFGAKLKFKSISYTDTYSRCWGKCLPARGEIYINNRLMEFPEWVEDYVIIHELAHLVEPNHSSAFWDLVERYRLKERAYGYLMAKAVDEEDED